MKIHLNVVYPQQFGLQEYLKKVYLDKYAINLMCFDEIPAPEYAAPASRRRIFYDNLNSCDALVSYSFPYDDPEYYRTNFGGKYPGYSPATEKSCFNFNRLFLQSLHSFTGYVLDTTLDNAPFPNESGVLAFVAAGNEPAINCHTFKTSDGDVQKFK